MFITAKNTYYAFDICPGFWHAIVSGFAAGIVCSIDRVRQEILAGDEEDDLVQWVQDDLPSDFCIDTGNAQVAASYGQVMQWVCGATVITDEQPSPQSRNRIKLPDVCAHFGVSHNHAFYMLRELGARFEVANPTAT